MRRYLPAVLACLLIVGCSRKEVTPADQKKPTDSAPAFENAALPDPVKPIELKFTAVDGRKVDLTQLRGKVVLIDFWATWCAPCRVIAPDIMGLYNKYHSQGLEIVGLSADTDKTELTEYVKKEAVPWPQYFDDTGELVLFQKSGVDNYPTLWLVNRKGVVVDSDFRAQWGHVVPVTAPETLAKLAAAIQKQIKAP